MYDEQIVAVRLRKRTILMPDLSRARLPAFVGTRIAELAWISRNTWFDGRSDITAGFYRAETDDEERDLLRGLPWLGARVTKTIGTDPAGDVQIVRHRLMTLLDGEPHGKHRLIGAPGETPVSRFCSFWELPVAENEREDAYIALADMIARHALAESRDGLARDFISPVLSEMRIAAIAPGLDCLGDVAEAVEAGLCARAILPIR